MMFSAEKKNIKCEKILKCAYGVQKDIIDITFGNRF